MTADGWIHGGVEANVRPHRQDARTRPGWIHLPADGCPAGLSWCNRPELSVTSGLEIFRMAMRDPYRTMRRL